MATLECQTCHNRKSTGNIINNNDGCIPHRGGLAIVYAGLLEFLTGTLQGSQPLLKCI